MTAVAASQAAGMRNARKRRKEAKKEDSRTKERIKYEREGFRDSFGIDGTKIEPIKVETNVAEQNCKEEEKDEKDFIQEELQHLSGYGLFAYQCKGFAESSKFNFFILYVILVAGVLVGLQTYPGTENWVVLSVIENLILLVFSFEILLKVLACGNKPWNYFIGSDWNWNLLDFVVVFLALPFWNWGNSASLLRLMRLLRLVKLVKKIPQLYLIISGLVGGLKAIGYILLLMFLIFYLYAIIGWYVFTPNDEFHFGNLLRGLLTLWRISTFEDWTNIFYINYYGCRSDMYTDAMFYERPAMAQNPEEAAAFSLILCNSEKSQAAPVISVIYFVSFVFISSLVMLSLFVGAVTMSMADSMEQLKLEKEIAYREKVLERAREKARSKSRTNLLGSNGPKPRRRVESLKTVASKIPFALQFRLRSSSAVQPTSKEETETALVETVETVEPQRKKSILPAFPFGKKSDEDENEAHGDFDDKDIAQLRYLINKALGRASFIGLEGTRSNALRSDSYCKNAFHNFSEWTGRFTSSKGFLNFITAVILFASALVGVTTFFDKDASNDTQDVKRIKFVVEILDLVVTIVFIGETALKTASYQFRPWQYFGTFKKPQLWNCFDYFIVIGSLVPGGGSTITILRLLRLLRVLKLLKALPELQIIVVALIKGLGSITYIGIILLLVFYMFAILGMILFQENDPWHFGSLHISLYTLFRCATLEDWTDVMYINMFGCNNYGYSLMEDLCESPVKWGAVSSLYFVLFTLVGGLVLMTLFIGVVTTSMEEAANEQKEQMAIEERVDELQKELELSDEEVKTFKAIFGLIDLDNGGTIDEEELAIGFISVGEMFTKDEIKGMVAEVDEDNSGEIDLAEFVQFMQIFRAATATKMADIAHIRAELRKQQQQNEDEAPSPTNQSSKSTSGSRPRSSILGMLSGKKNPYEESEKLDAFRLAAEGQTNKKALNRQMSSRRNLFRNQSSRSVLQFAKDMLGKSTREIPGVEVYPEPDPLQVAAAMAEYKPYDDQAPNTTGTLKRQDSAQQPFEENLESIDMVELH